MCSIESGFFSCFEVNLGILTIFIFALGVIHFLLKPNLLLATVGPLTLITTLYSIEAFARAGGGSNSKCGWLCLALYPFVFLYALYVTRRINKKVNQVKSALQDIARREPQWSEAALLKFANDNFRSIQTAWGNQDLEFLKNELHPILFADWKLQVQELIARNEKNILVGLSIEKLSIVDVQNYSQDESDEFTVCIDARADDQTIRNGEIIKSNNSDFREFWTYEWEKGRWMLREVTQANGWRRFVSASIIDQISRKKN